MHDTPLKLFREAIKDRYSIEREIGRGAYGTVLLAQDLALQRRVALKVLHAGLLEGVDRARLLHEFRVVARLIHPHILPVFDMGQAADLVYYATPFLEHVSLRERINDGPLALSEALQIAQEIADALTYAHGHAVVHRDIKPENVFLAEGKALVKDFWIARTLSRAAHETSTRLGFVIGTPGYMSPEQARGVPQPDPRSDVYSLAALICEMLTQELPFARSATDMFGQLSRDASIKDLPPSLPPRLASVLTKALAKEPSDRFTTPRELMNECWAADERVSTSLFSASSTSLETLHRVGSTHWRTLGTHEQGEPLTQGSSTLGTFGADQTVTRGPRVAYRKRLPALIGVLIVLLGASIFGITFGITTSFPTLPAPISLSVYLFLSLALAVSIGALLLRRKITGVQTTDVETTDRKLEQIRWKEPTDVRPVVRLAALRSDPAARLRSALQYRYDVIRELGRGGMAVVYFAHDLRYRRPRDVALKVLRPEYALAIGSERFIEEIEIMAELSHPDILTILDFGDVDGLPFYVMPYVRGESLKAYLDREGAVPVTFAISVAESVARALDYAHQHNKVHRDIKPENILLHEGRAVLADFGIALALDRAAERLTKPEMSLGTPEFMSPEQFSDALHIDGRTDVYSLGCVVYEMLAGAPPYTGTRQQLSLKHRDDPVPHIRAVRGEVPEPVDNAICKALAKNRNDRFETAGSFMDALTSRGTPFAIA